jgi:hypothetical protein
MTTLLEAGGVLRSDTRNRVRTAPDWREPLLDEFERGAFCGAHGHQVSDLCLLVEPPSKSGIDTAVDSLSHRPEFLWLCEPPCSSTCLSKGARRLFPSRLEFSHSPLRSCWLGRTGFM